MAKFPKFSDSHVGTNPMERCIIWKGEAYASRPSLSDSSRLNAQQYQEMIIINSLKVGYANVL